jgi:hypothetical protein
VSPAATEKAEVEPDHTSEAEFNGDSTLQKPIRFSQVGRVITSPQIGGARLINPQSPVNGKPSRNSNVSRSRRRLKLEKC